MTSRCPSIRLSAVVLIALLIAAPSSGNAITITYSALDVADSTPGEDLWQYTYTPAGFVFDSNTGFSIRFEIDLYSQLQDPPPPVSSDWDVLVLQPDPGLPAAGLYDALSLTDGASLADPFVVTFVWLGAPGTPGSQAFEINRFDAKGNFLETIATGTTIPEPSTFTLVTFGLIAMAVRRMEDWR